EDGLEALPDGTPSRAARFQVVSTHGVSPPLPERGVLREAVTEGDHRVTGGHGRGTGVYGRTDMAGRSLGSGGLSDGSTSGGTAHRTTGVVGGGVQLCGAPERVRATAAQACALSAEAGVDGWWAAIPGYSGVT